MLILTGLYILYRNSVYKIKYQRYLLALQAGVFAVSFGAGIISSLFGVGGGIIRTSKYVACPWIDDGYMAPTSQFTLMMTAYAVFTYSALGHPDYLWQAIVLSLGAFVRAR